MVEIKIEDLKKIQEEEEKLKKQINVRRNKINAYKKKIEKDRVHKMCEVAGFLFTEIADWKGENYNDYINLDLEYFKKFCLKNKEYLKQALLGKPTQKQSSNSPYNAVSEQKGTNTQPNNIYSQQPTNNNSYNF